mmetsp:Transcript_101639/g.163879  ORF Transcript_101639/g.163879 Transcript_101639/m.163879 type:complete len:99 (-) Transcript_101639:97-393(-)
MCTQEGYRAFCCRSPLAEVATREMRPSTMVEDGPNKRTVASSKKCFGEVTRVGRTAGSFHAYAMLLASQACPRSPRHRKLVIVFLPRQKKFECSVCVL